MTLGTVIGVIVCIIILYLVLSWWFDSYVYLSGLSDGKQQNVIKASKLSTASGHASNFAYSIWFYVNDWNYKFGDKKVIFNRNGSPEVSLDKFENNLTIDLGIYNHSASSTIESMTNLGSADSDPNCPHAPAGGGGGGGGNSGTHKCTVANVPLQRWVNVIMSVYGRSLDVYVDGKLVRTCVLPNVAHVNPTDDVVVTPNGGFEGWTSNFQYFSDAINPQQAWNIYKAGYGGSLLGDLFNKYVIKVEFLKDGQEQGSFEI